MQGNRIRQKSDQKGRLMQTKRFVVEIGSGVDLHGEDVTKAACRAVKDAISRSCHFKGKALGASSMILPAKSILCMPCHVAAFSTGDRTTLFSLLIFVVGMRGAGVIWFSGGRGGRRGHTFQSGLSVPKIAGTDDF